MARSQAPQPRQPERQQVAALGRRHGMCLVDHHTFEIAE